MREIRFRAWDNDNKKMAEVVALDWGNDGSIITCHLEYEDGKVEKKYPNKKYGDDIEFMQYTGLKDKNGKDIYEGDIFHLGDMTIKYIVEWIDTGFMGRQRTNKSCVGLDHWRERIEVIGNIYENQDLIK